MGLDLSQVAGSGPNQRIVRQDVLKASQQPASAAAGAGYTDMPLSNIRRVIAERLMESKRNIPHYYLTVDCEIDALLACVAPAPVMRRAWLGGCVRACTGPDPV